jgi:hypothetical protein
MELKSSLKRTKKKNFQLLPFSLRGLSPDDRELILRADYRVDERTGGLKA